MSQCIEHNSKSEVNSLAVLVIVFADVTEVCSESFHSQRTLDFSTLPLNDHT